MIAALSSQQFHHRQHSKHSHPYLEHHSDAPEPLEHNLTNQYVTLVLTLLPRKAPVDIDQIYPKYVRNLFPAIIS
jgi:hypothetical protein